MWKFSLLFLALSVTSCFANDTERQPRDLCYRYCGRGGIKQTGPYFGRQQVCYEICQNLLGKLLTKGPFIRYRSEDLIKNIEKVEEPFEKKSVEGPDNEKTLTERQPRDLCYRYCGRGGIKQTGPYLARQAEICYEICQTLLGKLLTRGPFLKYRSEVKPFTYFRKEDLIKTIEQESKIHTAKMAEAFLTGQKDLMCTKKSFCEVGSVSKLDPLTENVDLTINVINKMIESLGKNNLKDVKNIRSLVAAYKVGQMAKNTQICQSLFPCKTKEVANVVEGKMKCPDSIKLCPGYTISCALCGLFMPQTCAFICPLAGLYCGTAGYVCPSDAEVPIESEETEEIEEIEVPDEPEEEGSGFAQRNDDEIDIAEPDFEFTSNQDQLQPSEDNQFGDPSGGNPFGQFGFGVPYWPFAGFNQFRPSGGAGLFDNPWVESTGNNQFGQFGGGDPFAGYFGGPGNSFNYPFFARKMEIKSKEKLETEEAKEVTEIKGI